MNDVILTKKGIDKYEKIMALFYQTNVSENNDFQHLFNGFYQIRRNREWRNVYYDLLEKLKNKNVSIDKIITYLYKNTPQHKIELSFSSKLLHTLNPNMPIYDKNVAQKIGLNSIKPYWDTEKKISVSISIYNELINWYKTEKSLKYLQKFNILFPNHDIISNTKKIDFILWRNLL